MDPVPTTEGLPTGAQAGVMIGVLGGVFLSITVPMIIFSVYMHRQQRAAARAATQQTIEQALEQASALPAPRKPEWTESIEAVEKQRSLSKSTTTTTTAETASEMSAEEVPREALLGLRLPKASFKSIFVRPKQTVVDTVDLEQGPRRSATENMRKPNSSLAQQHEREQREWLAEAATRQWMF